MRILLATNNAAKVARMHFLLEGLVECVTPVDLGITAIEPREGSDIVQNARQKALVYVQKVDFPVLGMDSAFRIEGEVADPALVKRNALDGR
ncbi:MAG: hypothetical protein NUV56_00650, partial [Candidatus Uhrbacteria bacterium]|nr:hypothetical protein [Candidatus Uhrbacteria bacterium]